MDVDLENLTMSLAEYANDDEHNKRKTAKEFAMSLKALANPDTNMVVFKAELSLEDAEKIQVLMEENKPKEAFVTMKQSSNDIYVSTYGSTLEAEKGKFTNILEHIKENPTEPEVPVKEGDEEETDSNLMVP